jgi:DNA-directed RNA polymerase specialized sigma24 family protein
MLTAAPAGQGHTKGTTMIWRDRRSPGEAIDAEGERELRLIAQARAGAAWAVSALVARYQPPVVRYLVRLTGDPQRAQELAESIFVRMGRRVRGPHGGQQLRLWLLRAATDIGLDALRHPPRAQPPRLTAPARPVGLLVGRTGVRTSRNDAARVARPAPRTQRFVWQPPDDVSSGDYGPDDEGELAAHLSPRDALRHRLMRAVLAELPYGDAQCLALHLVGGLNQSEVATALGLAAPVARRRIVQGLQLFGRRYEAALASLGLPDDVRAHDQTAVPPHDELPPQSAPVRAEVEATTSDLDVPAAFASAHVATVDNGPPLGPIAEVIPAGAARPADAAPSAEASTAIAPVDDALLAPPVPEAPEAGSTQLASISEEEYAGAWGERAAGDDGHDAFANTWGTWSLFGSWAKLDTDAEPDALADADEMPLYFVDLPDADEPASLPAIEAMGAVQADEGSADRPPSSANSSLLIDLPWVAADMPAPSRRWHDATSDHILAAAMPPSEDASEVDIAAGGGAGHLEHDDQFLVVVEAEPRPPTSYDPRLPAAPVWEARRARVLSADGEAEDAIEPPFGWPA